MDIDTNPVPTCSEIAVHATISNSGRGKVSAPPEPPVYSPATLFQELKQRRISYCDLPNEIIEGFSAQAVPETRTALGQVDRRTYSLLREKIARDRKERIASDQYANQANSIMDVAGLRQMLAGLARDITLTSSPPSAFGCRLTAERAGIPTELSDDPRSLLSGFLLLAA